MKIVYGDQVIENASVVIQPSRLSPHDKPGRIKKVIELTVPADASNGGYAVRQLLGHDSDIGAKSVVMLEVALTQQQIERLKNITEDELRDIRNGVNPAMIYGVRVCDLEPMGVEEFITGKKWPRWFMLPPGLKDATGNEMVCIRRDSSQSGETFCLGGTRYLWHEWHGDVLQLEEITEQEAQAIIAHSVKPTGEWIGCVQWFQHTNPNAIIRRDSRDRCTYFEYDREPVPGLAWSENFTEWVKSGQWIEITQQEAEKRIEYNRRFAGLTPPYPKPQMCKREQYAGGGTPSPRICDVCLEGPCQRVIPIQTEGCDETQVQQQMIAANVAELTKLHQTVERSFEQLPADREVVNPLKDRRFKFGVDWASRPDIGATVQVNTLPLRFGEGRPLQLELRSSFDSEGIWLYAVDDDLRLAFVRPQDVGTKSYTFTIEVPCIHICGYPRVKWPVGYRHAVMPKDYGKEVMYFNDTRTGWGRGILRGMEKNNTEADRLIIDLPAKDEMFDPERITVGARLVFIVDQQTEGF